MARTNHVAEQLSIRLHAPCQTFGGGAGYLPVLLEQLA